MLGITILSTNIFNYFFDYNNKTVKIIGLIFSLLNLILCQVIYICFDFSYNMFQFVQKNFEVGSFNLYLGLDGLSMYFVLLTNIIIPISLLSNWSSILEKIK
jgi:NADH-ubiquinone oxidoreductase chain 4